MNFDECRYSKTKVYISEEQEKELYEAMKNGDDDARDDLIMGHKYLVIQIAREYALYGPYEDLLHEGFIGLINAVDKYDLKKGRLRVYAWPAVKYAIVKFLAINKHIVRLPEPQTAELLKLLKIKENLEFELSREPTIDELVKNELVVEHYKNYKKSTGLKTSLKDYVMLIEYGDPVSSLNAPLFEDSDMSLQDIVEDPWQQRLFDEVDLNDLQNVLMEILSDREKFILKSISSGWSGSQIAEKLGITPQGVSIAKLTAIKKIKVLVKKNPELTEIISEMGFKI